MKEFVARHRYARLTPRKGRYVMNLVRGLPVNEAMDLLAHTHKRAAHFIRKVLASAIANASQDPSVRVNRLRITKAYVDDGPTLRFRWRPGPQGRAMPFKKRTCHLTIFVGVEDEE